MDNSRSAEKPPRLDPAQADMMPPPPPPPPSTSTSTGAAASVTVVPPQALMTAVQPASGEHTLRPVVQNVVATVNLSCPLDLMKITFRTRNSEYNPARFNGVVMRINEPHTTALVFQTGKMVVTGARSEDAVNLAARKYARIIQKLGFPVRFVDFRIHNMVGTCDLRFPVRLEDLQQMHSQFCSFEPELFPGLVYRLVKPRVVLLIFVNGKVVLTGAKTRKELNEAIDTMFPIIKSFKKQ
ncbi:uncharacterized protein LOC134541785 isoform X2 [Bacillus rossius redtenbacheri]|uniref:uncharacterized protein LOC134541785 isoform X2 n=1 Tax=Bacillus rossius redtenbacheri TaxID=93214 RepID=UPI002FDCFF5F